MPIPNYLLAFDFLHCIESVMENRLSQTQRNASGTEDTIRRYVRLDLIYQPISLHLPNLDCVRIQFHVATPLSRDCGRTHRLSICKYIHQIKIKLYTFLKAIGKPT